MRLSSTTPLRKLPPDLNKSEVLRERKKLNEKSTAVAKGAGRFK